MTDLALGNKVGTCFADKMIPGLCCAIVASIRIEASSWANSLLKCSIEVRQCVKRPLSI